MLKALLVDLDGTLVDTHAANVEAYSAAIHEFGLPFDRALIAASVGNLPWRQMLKQVLGPVPSDLARQIAERKRSVYPEYFDLVSVNERLADCIRLLCPPLAAAVVTSASRMSAESVLRAKNLSGLFKVTVTSDDCEKAKPDPAPYSMAASKLGVSPDECLVFEDSDVGRASARAFGASTMMVDWRR